MVKVSFVMPAFKASFLEKAIRSIVQQNEPDWELIIVDDCSPEDLRSIVKRFDDPRISYFRNEENIGGKNLVLQWNHCIGKATGEWVVMASDDDIYADSFCKSVLDLAKNHPETNLVRARVGVIGTEGQILYNDGKFPDFISGEQFLHEWMAGLMITCVGNFAFRRNSLLACGGFKEFPCAFCSDVATPLMLSDKGVANTSDLGFFFRQSEIHLSGDRSKVLEKMEASQQFFEWLRNFAPTFDRKWIHEKCIYDCFNQTVRYASLRELPGYLKACREAGTLEKLIMFLRWVKKSVTV